MDTGGKPVVLVLEDEALVRAGMRALIEASEPAAEVHEAGSYEEALECLARHAIDIAFLDIDLKTARSGLDVLEHIHTRGLPCRAIMLSASADEATVRKCLQEGASGYIQKDTNPDNLFRRALDTVFQDRIFLPPSVIRRRRDAPQDANAGGGPSHHDIALTVRQREALYYLYQGFSNKVIAYKMGVSESTVANEYNTKLFKIFKVSSRTKLMAKIAELGLQIRKPATDPDP